MYFLYYTVFPWFVLSRTGEDDLPKLFAAFSDMAQSPARRRRSRTPASSRSRSRSRSRGRSRSRSRSARSVSESEGARSRSSSSTPGTYRRSRRRVYSEEEEEEGGSRVSVPDFTGFSYFGCSERLVLTEKVTISIAGRDEKVDAHSADSEARRLDLSHVCDSCSS